MADLIVVSSFSLVLVGCGSPDAVHTDGSVAADAAPADATGGAPAVDAAVDASSACTLTATGTLGDDLSDVYRFTIASLPASISMTLTSNMEQPQIRVSGNFGAFCNPAPCGGNVPLANPALNLDYSFTEIGDYFVQVDNFSSGGDYSVSGAIDGDTAACATWQLR